MSGPVRKRVVHGKGARSKAGVTYESVGTDEMRSPPPGSADPIDRRSDGTLTSAGAAAAARLRWEAAKVPNFAERELTFVPESSFAPFDTARRDLLATRRRELHEQTGGVSAGVGATLRGEAWLTAFAEYWAAVGAQTGDGEAMERAMRFFKSASGERARAWDMASTEAAARPRRTIADSIEAEAEKRLAAARVAAGEEMPQ